jgi:hypothetical protein
MVPKDTVLEVSQVYIRNDGWFMSSLTFKPVSGPGFDLAIQGDYEDKKRCLTKCLEELKKQLQEGYIDQDADWYYTVEGFSLFYKKPENSKFIFYKKGSKDDYERWCNHPPKDVVVLSCYKSDVEGMIQKQEKILLNMKPSKPNKNFQRVIRISLEDIEQWEVEIIKRAEKNK